jgi:DNA-binding transcriptional regulator YdaS (Cro superfamily)
MKDPGLEFRRLISRAGYTQSIIAYELGISQASLSGWAAKGCPASRALELSRLLSVPIEEVEPAVYRPKTRVKRPRAPYSTLAFEGIEEAVDALILSIRNARLTKDDVQLLSTLTERLSLS